MLSWVATQARRFTGSTLPWTNVYGLVRTILAIASILTLALNDMGTLFRPAAGLVTSPPFCDGLRRFDAFCIAPAVGPEIRRWICVALLVIVASGYRPRLTGLIQWWIAFSYQASAVVLEGGDQITALLAFFLVPITLTDPRRWHWQALPPEAPARTNEVGRLVGAMCLGAIRLQVAIIYLHAAIGKMSVDEWVNGTALYYWASHPVFGAPSWLRPLVMPILANAYAISALTWSVMVLELSLGMALVMSPGGRRRMFPLGVMLHVGIALLHGLMTFSIIMVGALILYLRPLERSFKVPTRLAVKQGLGSSSSMRKPSSAQSLELS